MAVLWTGPSPVVELAADNTDVSDLDNELCSEPESPDVASDREVLSDRDQAKENEFDQEVSEEANYGETMRGVGSFMGWHQILHFKLALMTGCAGN